MAIVKNNPTTENEVKAFDTRALITSISSERKHILVEQMCVCEIRLSQTEVRQLAKGAELYTSKIEEESHIDSVVFDAFVRLSNYRFNLEESDETRDHNKESMKISRPELKVFKTFLELRMEHCERVREIEIEKQETGKIRVDARPESFEIFEQDTYIIQKMLLINIREALLGEVVEEY